MQAALPDRTRLPWGEVARLSLALQNLLCLPLRLFKHCPGLLPFFFFLDSTANSPSGFVAISSAREILKHPYGLL